MNGVAELNKPLQTNVAVKGGIRPFGFTTGVWLVFMTRSTELKGK